MNYLFKIKDMLKECDVLYIETINKKNGWIGTASFLTNGEDKIMVFEGSGDGSNDASYPFDEFLEKYNFSLKVEGCKYEY